MRKVLVFTTIKDFSNDIKTFKIIEKLINPNDEIISASVLLTQSVLKPAFTSGTEIINISSMKIREYMNDIDSFIGIIDIKDLTEDEKTQIQTIIKSMRGRRKQYTIINYKKGER